MSEKPDLTLSGVEETLLLPLYGRAMESQRPDALIKDEKAVELVTQMRLDFSPVRQLRITELQTVIRIILTREIDRYARDFLSRYPQAVVVHIGCGLDTRFERIGCNQPDISRVEWYDLDLPQVIELRRKLIGGEGPRYHLLSCSVLEDAWMEAVKGPAELAAHAPRPVLFLAEAVFIFFTEVQVRSLVLKLRDRFPGAELVFDGWKPFEIWLGNRYLSPSKFAGLMQWGISSGHEIEGWASSSPAGARIRLLEAWDFFDQPEPRLSSYRWMKPLFRLFKPIRVFHFQLGKIAG